MLSVLEVLFLEQDPVTQVRMAVRERTSLPNLIGWLTQNREINLPLEEKLKATNLVEILFPLQSILPVTILNNLPLENKPS